MIDDIVSQILERIYKETGIVLSRQTDRDRIERYLGRGGHLPLENESLSKELIDLVTTNETYFEREPDHFNILIDVLLPEIDLINMASPIRILCAPCSSGEEVYSIALRIEHSPRRFKRPIEIIGVDLNHKMIEKACNGIYSERSIHALDTYVIEKSFEKIKEGYKILPLEKSAVQFLSGNLFNDDLWRLLGKFEIIFSRNMMIYFDNIKNRELLERFKTHSKYYLILGHADDHLQAKEIFTPLRFERGIIYKI